jgi:hypothetical protein
MCELLHIEIHDNQEMMDFEYAHHLELAIAEVQA